MTTTYITDENKRIDVPDGVTLAQFWASNAAPGTPLPTIIMTQGPEVPDWVRGPLPADTFAAYTAEMKKWQASQAAAKPARGLGGWLMLGVLAVGAVWLMRKKG